MIYHYSDISCRNRLASSHEKSKNNPSILNAMKTLIASLVVIILTASAANAQWYGDCGRAYVNQRFVRCNYYGSGGGCANGYYGGGYGYPNSSSFGNQYGQWGNGQGATLSAIAQIISAAAPILAPRPVVVEQPQYAPGYVSPRPVGVY